MEFSVRSACATGDVIGARKTYFVAVALIMIAITCWAGNFVIGRAIRNDFPPVSLAFWRWVLASLLLLPIALRADRSQWRAAGRDFRVVFGFFSDGSQVVWDFFFGRSQNSLIPHSLHFGRCSNITEN